MDEEQLTPCMTTSFAILPWYLDQAYDTEEGDDDEGDVEERISDEEASHERVAIAPSGTTISFTDSSELVSGTEKK